MTLSTVDLIHRYTPRGTAEKTELYTQFVVNAVTLQSLYAVARGLGNNQLTCTPTPSGAPACERNKTRSPKVHTDGPHAMSTLQQQHRP